MSGAVEGVAIGPFLDGFFAVVEDEPDAVALGRVGAEVAAKFDEECGGGGSVVGSDEVDIAEGVVGLVVGSEDDDAVFLAGIAHDVVAHAEEPGGGAGGEGVGFEVTLGDLGGEVGLDELLGFEVAGRSNPAFGGCGEVLLGEGVDGLTAELCGGGLGEGVGGCEQENEQRQR